MSKKKTSKSTMVKKTTAEKPIALTVKIDGDLYVRLATLRAQQRRTHQEIVKQALEEFLDRMGG